MELEGKVAIVTGASKGIGRAIAIELAKEGASILINYNTDLNGAEETLKLVKEQGGYGEIFKGDVSNLSICHDMIQKCIDTFGKVDVLVNNAGISKVALLIDHSEDDIINLLHTNLLGVINSSKAVLPFMISKKSGVIINVSSMWGQYGASCETVYSATKGGIDSFTKALGREVGPSNIRVNAVSPGVINTEMNAWLSEDEKKELEMEIPLCRMGEPSEIGKLIAFLCSDKGKYINTQIIRVDGGMI